MSIQRCGSRLSVHPPGSGSARRRRDATDRAMKKSCLVLGVLFLLALTAGIGVVAMKAPLWWAKGKHAVEQAMAEQQRISDLETKWRPPSEKPDAAWAPAELSTWKLKQVEAVSGWPDLNEARVAQRMIYEYEGLTVEIGVMAANDLEKEVLIERIVEAAKTPGKGHRTTTIVNRTHVRSGNLNTRLWWLKNWLFVFRSKDVDPTIEEKYLNAISGSRMVEKE